MPPSSCIYYFRETWQYSIQKMISSKIKHKLLFSFSHNISVKNCYPFCISMNYTFEYIYIRHAYNSSTLWTNYITKLQHALLCMARLPSTIQGVPVLSTFFFFRFFFMLYIWTEVYIYMKTRMLFKVALWLMKYF